MPVLLYTDPKMIAALMQADINILEIGEGFTDHERLKDLGKKGEQHFPIVVTSKAWAMRGVDYRAKEFGIYLVINQGFETQRDCDQGLARVGRFGDKCERVITHGT